MALASLTYPVDAIMRARTLHAARKKIRDDCIRKRNKIYFIIIIISEKSKGRNFFSVFKISFHPSISDFNFFVKDTIDVCLAVLTLETSNQYPFFIFEVSVYKCLRNMCTTIYDVRSSYT